MGYNQPLKRRTAIDNEGIEHTEPLKWWAEHPDTYNRYDKKITVDDIRHRGYVQKARGYTDREVVGLDTPKLASNGRTYKKKIDPEEKKKMMNSFIMGRPCK